MSLLTVASGQSVWRGYEYYTEHKVLQMQQTGERIISGTVSGSDGNVYHATIDIDHPKRSKCDCPHAAGRLVVCKHMIAIYFTAFPSEATQYLEDLEACYEEGEQREAELAEELEKYVRRLKKSELQEKLLELLYSGPDWQYDRFVRDNLEY